MAQYPDLKKAGLKATAPRLRVLEVLHHSKGHHLTADEIYQRLVESGEVVGLATVYRVLTQFEEAKLVRRHHFEGGHSVFELDTGAHHDHMVCMETGRVIEFVNSDIERIQRDIASSHGYELVDHHFVLYVRPKQTEE